MSKHSTFLIIFLLALGTPLTCSTRSWGAGFDLGAGPLASTFDSLNMRFAGNWPFGGCPAVACDELRKLVFMGSGGGVYILDVQDPLAPMKLSESLRTRDVVRDLFYEASSQRLYVADRLAGVEIWDVEKATAPARIGHIATPDSACGICVSDAYAYVACGDSGLRVIDVSEPKDPLEVSHCHIPGNSQGVDVAGSYAYVATMREGLHVVNVSDPANPQWSGFVDLPPGSCRVALSGSFAFVPSSSYGLSIVDVSIPTNPCRIWDMATPYACDVYVIDNHAYLADYYGGVYVLDISIPTDPQVIGRSKSCYATYLCGAEPYLYAVNPSVLRIINVTNPTDPEEIQYYSAPSHARSVLVSDKYAYVADDYAGLFTIDVSDPASPHEVGNCDLDERALDLCVSSPHAYVACGYGGLVMVNISQPENPRRVGSCSTAGWASKVCVSGFHVYVLDEEGLLITDISRHGMPHAVGRWDFKFLWSICVSDIYAYVTGSDSALHVVDISNPSSPQEVGCYHTEDRVGPVCASGSYAYLTDASGALRVIDVSNPADPVEVGSCNIPSSAWGATVSASYVYVADYCSGVRVVDASTAADPREVAYYDAPKGVEGVCVSGSYAYLADGQCGIQIYENLLVGIEESEASVSPTSLRLLGNPVRGDCIRLKVGLARAETVVLELYNAAGQNVKSFSPGRFSSGEHDVELSADGLRSGVYFLKHGVRRTGQTVKLVIVR